MKMRAILLTLLCTASLALANELIKKYEVKYAIGTGPTREIVVQSDTEYHAQQTFHDLMPQARYITIREIK